MTNDIGLEDTLQVAVLSIGHNNIKLLMFINRVEERPLRLQKSFHNSGITVNKIRHNKCLEADLFGGFPKALVLKRVHYALLFLAIIHVFSKILMV